MQPQDHAMSSTPKLRAIICAKCPRCRRGNIFRGAAYHFGANATFTHCPHCRLQFEVEPGYFYGAMYISYAFNIVESVAAALLTYIITGNTRSPWLYVSAILSVCIVLSPVNFRYSRVLLLHLLSPMIGYQEYLDTDDRKADF